MPHSLAMPKSINRTVPRASRMMLGVFRSRWMTPTSWMAARPSATWSAVRRASSAGRPPPWRSTWRRSTPSIISIEM